jgi:hypothetical protein
MLGAGGGFPVATIEFFWKQKFVLLRHKTSDLIV